MTRRRNLFAMPFFVVVDRSIDRASELFFLSWFCEHISTAGKRTRRKKVMASPPDEEADVARATPAAHPSRVLAALRGFRDRLVDECRVEVRRKK